MKVTFLSFLLFLYVRSEIIVEVRTPITNQQELQDSQNLKMTLNWRNQFFPQSKSTFRISGLVDGRNTLELRSHLFSYPILFVDSENGQPKTVIFVNPFTREMISKQPIKGPILVQSLSTINYFEQQASFSIASFLFSGPGIMVAITLLMLYCSQTVMPALEEAQKAPDAADLQLK